MHQLSCGISPSTECCTSNERACPNRCIPEEWICDGIADCLRGEDEILDECISLNFDCSDSPNGQLELVKTDTSAGLEAPRGLLQVCVNGSRGGILPIVWDTKSATVACRQLGLGQGVLMGIIIIPEMLKFHQLIIGDHVIDLKCYANNIIIILHIDLI